MTTADRVRQAAAKIRETAHTADRVMPDEWHVAADLERYHSFDEEDAAHITLWSPAVALVLADWLDGIAADKTAGRGTIHPRAIDLTNLILGDTA